MKTTTFCSNTFFQKILRIIIIGFLLSTSTFATNWYVDNAANGSNNGTSWANAWESFSAINWSSVASGDVIYLSGGTTSKTYSGQLTISKAGVTIDKGANSPSPSGHSGTVRIDGGSYCVYSTYDNVTVKNLELFSASTNGIRFNGSNCLIENNYLHDMSNQAIHVRGSYQTVRGNRITTVSSGSGQTDGIVVYGTTGSTTGVIIEKNWIKLTNQVGGHNDCIQSNQATNITIRWNYCENTKNDLADAQCIYLTEMYGSSKVYGNIMILPYGGQAFGHRNLSIGNAQLYLYNNTIKFGTGYRPLYITETSGPYIKNNIIWRTANGQLILMTGWGTGNGSRINNNIWYTPSSGNYFTINGSNRSWSYWTGTYGCDANGMYQDPSLSSCLSPDASGDPSVGAGTNLGSEYDDGLDMSLCGTSGYDDFLPVATVDRDVTGGSSWDIGAYEYGSGGCTPPSLPSGAYQAESGTLVSPMGQVSDACDASGGYYIRTTTSNSGTATYTVNVAEDGVYKLTGRVKTADNGSNSFFVTVDGGTEYQWHVAVTGSSWSEEDGYTDVNLTQLYEVELTSGNHTLVFGGRETNTNLDYFYLTKTGEIPSSGAVRIEAGNGSTYTDTYGNVWSADQYYTGGTTVDRGSISISNTVDDKIYQTERYGMTAYAIPVANGTYTVRLHMAETSPSITGSGQRIFTVTAEGSTPAGWSNIDLYAEAGGKNIAWIKTATVVVSDGTLNLGFSASANNPLINGIEVIPGTTVRLEAGNTSTFTDHIGNLFAADQYYTGGNTVDRGAIAISNTVDDRIYQTERYSMTAYAIPVVNGTYTVRLHMAETSPSITSSGQRVFTVTAEGTTPSGWSNIDLYVIGGNTKNVAIIRSATVTVSDGTLNLGFSASANNPLINGIEVTPNNEFLSKKAEAQQAASLPTEYVLENNYPNPFNPTTIIQFALPESGNFSLKVYNILGQEVAALVDGQLSAGTHRVNFDASNLSSGMYIYRLAGNNVNLVKKMLLLR